DRDGLLRGRLRVPRHEDLELALGDHVAVLVRALGDLEVGGVAIRGGPGDVAGGVLDLAGDLLAGRRVDALVDRLTRRALGGGDRPVALQRRPGRLADSDGEVVRGPAEVDALHRIAGDLRRAVAAA